MRHFILRPLIAAAVLAIAVATSFAQSAVPRTSTPPPLAGVAPPLPKSVTMKALAGHYVEGAGYVTFFYQKTKGYGGTFSECEANCLADAKCKMIEFYKPLRKCHLYDHTKWSGKSRDADVALKQGG